MLTGPVSILSSSARPSVQMEETPSEGPSGSPRKAGKSRVAPTLAIWVVVAGLVGLGWLSAQDPFMGLPLSHPINLILFGLCLAVGFGFTAGIWLSRRDE